MRYAFIEDHRATWPIAIPCRVLAVSRSGYDQWRRRPVSERAKRRESLTAPIREFHGGQRPVHSEGGGLVDVGADRQPTGGRCVGDGCVA